MQNLDFLKEKGITDLCFLDFECYYSVEYTLKKLSTSMYIFDDQFLIHGVGIKHIRYNSKLPQDKYISDLSTMKKYFDSIDWSKTALICHHTHFDGLILTHYFGHNPGYYLCTLSMARPILQNLLPGLDIDTIAKHFGVQGKTKGLDNTKGKRELTLQESIDLGNYCINDVDMLYQVFYKLLHFFPKFEINIIDWHIRMYTEGEYIVDAKLADEEITRIETEKSAMFQRVSKLFPAEIIIESELDILKALRSGKKLAEIIEYNKLITPMKISPTTNKPTYAFAKNDLTFMAFKNNLVNPAAPLLFEARVTAKSDTALNKAKLLRKFADHPPFPMYINYSRAQTMRSSGGDKLNGQNLPRGGNARKCLTAPKDHICLSIDSSGIELRVALWLADQLDMMKNINNGIDLYKVMASHIYETDYDKITKGQRGIGKVAILSCLGADTMVLCNTGIKPITHITTLDKVWNGSKFVCHQGLVTKGLKKTLKISEVSITANHRVLSGTSWTEAMLINTNANTHYQALATAAESLLSLDTYWQDILLDTNLYLLNVNAIIQNMLSICTTLKPLKRHGVYIAEKNINKISVKCTGVTRTLYLMMSTVEDYLIELQHVYKDAITLKIKTSSVTENEVLQYKKIGAIKEKDDVNSLHTLYHYLDGILQNWNLTESITTSDIKKVIYDLLHDMRTSIIDAVCIKYSLNPPKLNKKILRSAKQSHNLKPVSENLKPEKVYDLLECEEGNRFTIITEDGPMIVHNCQYGAGIPTFDTMLKSGAMAAPIILPLREVQRIHKTYRRVFDQVPLLWSKCGNFLYAMTKSCKNYPTPKAKDRIEIYGGIGVEYKGMQFVNERIYTHHGMNLYYPELTEHNGSFNYKSGKQTKHIYGALCTNNIAQHIARNIVYFQIGLLNERYKPIHIVHDEATIIVHRDEFDEAKAFAEKCFSTAPDYFTGINLKGEAEWGFNDQGISYYAK